MRVDYKHVFVVWAFALFLCTVAQCQKIVGPSPGEPVALGQPMLFQVQDMQPGDQVVWRVITPNGLDGMTVIQPTSPADYIVDTGLQYVGDVQVLCTVVNHETKVFVQEIVQAVIEGTPPTPPTPGRPGPTPGEYDGPNQFGVGKVSYDKAPMYDAEVVNMMVRAAEHLYGRPTLKVIYTTEKEKNKTDYNVLVYIKNQLDPEWADWYNAVFDHLESESLGVLELRDWYEALREAAAGVERRKPQ